MRIYKTRIYIVYLTDGRYDENWAVRANTARNATRLAKLASFPEGLKHRNTSRADEQDLTDLKEAGIDPKPGQAVLWDAGT